MDVCVWVKRCVVRRNDGVPDYRFGGRDGVRRGRWIGRGDVKEDLLGVPVEEGCEVWRSQFSQ